MGERAGHTSTMSTCRTNYTRSGRVEVSKTYNASTATTFGNCDAFLSHSWHDNLDAKWTALHRWSEAFRQKHGRSPTFWLDKVCIDQTNIARDLQCLPVFLGACNSLLIS